MDCIPGFGATTPRIVTMTKTFPVATRLLHWTMAVLIVVMLFIGVAMVS
jgi:cytochrome b561